MTPEEINQLGMLTASLQSAVAYRDSEPGELKKIAKVLMDWAHAEDVDRSEIYSVWRNEWHSSING